MKDLLKRPLFLILLVALLALIGVEISTLRFSLAHRLISSNDAVRNKALSEIPSLLPEQRQKLVAELLREQRNAKPKPKRFALYAMRINGGKSPEVVDVFVSSLGDNDPHVRTEAQLALLEVGEPAMAAVASAAKSDNDVIREGALYVLEKSGEPGVALLIPLLNGNPTRALPVVKILGRLGANAKPALPNLIALLNSPDADLRLEAALVANNLKRPAPEALPVLARALKERTWDKRSVEIVRAIEDMGAVAKSVVPDITKAMLESEDNFSDPLAAKPVLAQALSALDPRRSELVDLGFDLRQKNPALRYRAAYALSVMDPPNPGALESLMGALNETDLNVLARVLVAIKRIGIDKTERFGEAAVRLNAAAARVKAKNIEGFSAVY